MKTELGASRVFETAGTGPGGMETKEPRFKCSGCEQAIQRGRSMLFLPNKKLRFCAQACLLMHSKKLGLSTSDMLDVDLEIA